MAKVVVVSKDRCCWTRGETRLSANGSGSGDTVSTLHVSTSHMGTQYMTDITEQDKFRDA